MLSRLVPLVAACALLASLAAAQAVQQTPQGPQVRAGGRRLQSNLPALDRRWRRPAAGRWGGVRVLGTLAARHSSIPICSSPLQPPLLRDDPPAEASCADVARLPPGADRCAFVRERCEAGSVLAYPSLYYCHVAPHGVLATAAMVVRRRLRAGLVGWLLLASTLSAARSVGCLQQCMAHTGASPARLHPCRCCAARCWCCCSA